MSETTLIEKIKDDAAKAAADIKANATTEVEAIQRETEAEIAERKTVAAHSLEKEKAQRELVALSRATQAAKIAVQKAKRNGIDTAVTTVCDSIIAQDSAEYVTYFVTRARAIVPEGTVATTVEAPKAREGETTDIISQLGLTANVQVNPGIAAGFILRTEDGVYDITLARLVNEKRAELESLIIKKVS